MITLHLINILTCTASHPEDLGGIWAEQHIRDLDTRFNKPSKILDKNYDGDYDVWLEGARVEVKASRATNTKKGGSLVSKALSDGSSEPMWMNFQQLKVDSCDVFIFIGVWVNKIVYWVLSKKEVKNNPYLSHQHRGGIEYQVGITDKNIGEFNKYMVSPHRLADKVLSLAKSN